MPPNLKTSSLYLSELELGGGRLKETFRATFESKISQVRGTRPNYSSWIMNVICSTAFHWLYSNSGREHKKLSSVTSFPFSCTTVPQAFIVDFWCFLCVLSCIFFNTAPRSPKVGKNVDKSLLIIAVG